MNEIREAELFVVVVVVVIVYQLEATLGDGEGVFAVVKLSRQTVYFFVGEADAYKQSPVIARVTSGANRAGASSSLPKISSLSSVGRSGKR
jgi:hypothetical protein